MRVLIVDDQKNSSELAAQLRSAGHSVVGTVATSRDAAQLANENPIDVALIDIDMEDMGESADLAIDLAADRHIDVVLCTAKSDLARRCQSGAVGLLSKPFRAQDVLDGLSAISAVNSGHSAARFPSTFELLVSPQ
jgi:CheY-like chemotaxis protein